MAEPLSAREEILQRIRAKLAAQTTDVAAEHQTIPRLYAREGTLGYEDKLHLFIDRLEDYDAQVIRTTSQQIASAVAQLLASREQRELLVSEGIPAEWLPAGITILLDGNLDYSAINKVATVLTGCTVGIATTGTIILQHDAPEGRRALTLIPDFHICVIYASQIVETVSEGIARISKKQEQPVTFISGPSATSDIEMTRICGVHGPRYLGLVIVEEA
ncbi:MAG: LutC/YkgG family protein [Acidobacteriaceae bacterium]